MLQKRARCARCSDTKVTYKSQAFAATRMRALHTQITQK